MQIITRFVHAVANLLEKSSETSRQTRFAVGTFRQCLVVALLAISVPASRAQFWLTEYATNNTGFEAVPLPEGGNTNYGPGPLLVNGWTYSGDAGIARDSVNKTNDLMTILSSYGGGNYAFLRASANPCTLQGTVNIPLRGDYQLHFYCPSPYTAWAVYHDTIVTDPLGHVLAQAQRDVQRSFPDQTLSFTVTNPGPHIITFGNLTNHPGTTNNVVLLDNVSVIKTDFGVLTNGAFDASPLASGQFQYLAGQSQPVAGWAYGGNAGIASDSSGKINFATGSSGVYSGTNYAFLQTSNGTPGFMEQAVLVPTTGRWLMSFKFAGRKAGAGFGGNAIFRASVLNYDGTPLVTKQCVVSSSQLFTNQSLSFTASSTGPFRLRFDNLQDTSGSNNAVFIDEVKIDHYDFFMVRNSSLDIMNTTGSRWYFYTAPTPSQAHMSRMDNLLLSETPWGSPGFLYDAPNYVQDRLFQGEFLRVYSENLPNNTLISIPAAFTPLGTKFYFNILVGDSPFVRSINIIDPSPSAATSVRWQVILSQDVQDVTANNFVLFNPNGITNPAITSVTGSGSNWIVTASTGKGYGLLGLNWNATADERPNVPVKFSGQVYDFTQLPMITQDPVSVTNIGGVAVTLHAAAALRDGGTPTYQWFEGDSRFPNAAVVVSGATNTALTLPATTNGFIRSFFIRAYNGPGYYRDSLTATVRIIAPPSIVSQPADQWISFGQTATLSVGAGGTAPFYYQWYYGPVGNTSNLLGTTASLATPALNTNATFWVRVLNDAGSNYAVTSRVALVRILTQLTQQPAAVAGCQGGTSTFTVAFSAPANIPTAIQWQKRASGASFGDIPGATNTSYSTPVVSPADDGSAFRARISNADTNLISNEAALSVILPPTILSQPADQTIDAGQTAALSINVSGTAPFRYQWYNGLLGDTSHPLGTNSSLTTPVLATNAPFWVRVLNDACPISAVTSRVATVHITPKFTQQPSSLAVCLSNAATFTVSFSAPSNVLTAIQWQKKATGGSFGDISDATNTSYITPPVSAEDDGSAFRARFSNADTNLISNEAALSVILPPTITSQPVDQRIDTLQMATLSVGVSGTPPFQYQWYNGTAGDTSRPAGTNSSLSVPLILTNATFWVRVFNGACSSQAVTSRVATVRINSKLVTQPYGVTVCLSNSATFTASFSAPANDPLTIQWQRRVLGGSFTNIPGAASASFSIPAVSPTDDGCFFRAVASNSDTNFISIEVPLSVIAIPAPTIVYNFTNGLPTNTTAYGSTVVSGQQLLLNDATSAQNGAWLTADPAPGQAVNGFVAEFTSNITPGPGGQTGDGFSFNWATDLPNGTYASGEEGEGSGLRVCFDTFSNSGNEAPAIDVKWGTNVIGHFYALFLPLSGTADVKIRLNTDGTLDLTYRCVSIFTRLPIPGFKPQSNARFGFGSRTGAAIEAVAINNLSLQLFVDPTPGAPYFTSMAKSPSGMILQGSGQPAAQYPLFTSEDLVNWQFRTNVTLDSNGHFQFVDQDISAPQRFYRLKATP